MQVNHGFDVVDADEKVAKLQRQAQIRARNALWFIGLLTVAFLTLLTSGVGPPAGGEKMIRNRGMKEKKMFHLPPLSIYRAEVEDANGQRVSLGQYAGNVTLVVNTACQWGQTRATFNELAVLQEKFKHRGFSVLAFPTNDFRQELGSNEEIQDFVQHEFPQVTFPVFGTSLLKQNPVYQLLRQQRPRDEVKHNFFKFLVDRDGMAVSFFVKKDRALSLAPMIEELLSKPALA